MIKKHSSIKHIQVSKANAVMVTVISVTVFLVVFALFSTRALLDQRSYQNRVITEKEKALRQLESNFDTANSLASSYRAFVERPQNIIDGLTDGKGERDGDNAKIILDALPSKYDFPGLISSVEKVLLDNNYTIEAIGGQDDEITQNTTEEVTPTPVDMPFTVTVKGSYASMKSLLTLMERSIRPINFQNLTFTGEDNNIQLEIKAKSYYLPNKQFNVLYEEVK